jgi:hypothetical protein
VLELAIAAIAARRELERETAESSSDDLSPGAVRARRLRERRRRRVVLQIPLDVYAGDLDLLRRSGFLSGGTNPEAVADALQAVLLRAFLSSPLHGPWRERISKQRSRLQSLGHAAEAQE